ncbi:MAG: hypothetical protein ACETVN_03175 [Asgard group archaeon]
MKALAVDPRKKNITRVINIPKPTPKENEILLAYILILWSFLK